MHASIPTTYRGVRFRSRLEAKYACLFDLLGWSWEYEPLDLNGWIPDFLIRSAASKLPVLAEIKPCLGENPPRNVEIQIEQALGAPKPRELTGEGTHFDVWEEFFDRLAYEPVIFGAAPQVFGVDVYKGEHPDFCAEFGLPANPHFGRLTCNWQLERGMGWQLQFAPVDNGHFRQLWNDATNTIQWKAPR